MANLHRTQVKAGRLFFLRTTLKQWVRIMKWDWGNDPPWIHNEQTQVGVLSSAIFLSGGQALLEYSTEKRHRRKWTLGRGDIWFLINYKEYIGEAKTCSPSIGKRGYIRNYWGNLDNATRAIKCVPRISAVTASPPRRLGLLFISPSLSPDVTEIGEKLERWVAEIHRSFYGTATAMAWSFPKEYREFKDEGRYYPGSVLLIRPLRASYL